MSEHQHPLRLGELLDYWLGDMPEAESTRIEEHVFDCSECAARLEAVVESGASLVALVRGGRVSARATTALVNRFARDTLNIRQYTLRPGEVVACTVSPHDDFLMARFVLEELPAGRLDLLVQHENESHVARIEDVTVDTRAKEIKTLVPARATQGAPSERIHYLLVTPEAGGERVVGKYTLDHTAMNEA